jgi:hypothetical protein
MKNILILLAKYKLILIVVGVVLASGATYFVSQSVLNNPKSNNIADSNEETKPVDETGYIYVDGGAGTLSNFSEYGYSYIGESARGTEAYLADKGATATYKFTAEKAGSYRLEISLSDDAVHDNGARNATVTLNGGGTVFYKHQSENTNGWKWYSLGQLSIKKGKNTVTFIKDETTSAAFVMDQFRFVPIILSE